MELQQYVNLKQAKKLKEIGFPQLDGAQYFYSTDGKNFDRAHINYVNILEGCQFTFESIIKYCAPELETVRAWLRNYKEIKIFVKEVKNIYGIKGYNAYIANHPCLLKHYWSSTFEEAVSHGIDEVLESFFNKDSNDNIDNDYVDLGLPSGTLWAKCNLGAEHEYDFGKYYQWGDIVGYEGDEAKAHSSWATAPFNGGASDFDENYFASVKGDVCPNGVLARGYDAVFVATDGKAHMPTKAQCEELYYNTTSKWTTVNGVAGRKFTSNTNGNSIFIPAAGYVNDGRFIGVGSYSDVLSSSLDSSNPHYAYDMDSDRKGVYLANGSGRCFEFSLRGVITNN